MSIINRIAEILVLLGALNWGLVGLFKYNLVDSLFKPESTVSKIIYTLVGLSGLYILLRYFF